MEPTKALLELAKQLGWRMAIVPFVRRAEAIQAIVNRYERGELDEAFYQEYLAPMFAEPLPEPPTPRSLILVAVPDRPVRMHFTLDGAEFEVLTAPGYLKAPDPRPSVAVAEVLTPLGHSIAPAFAPLKTLGTMSGFSRYGRNNISYVPGFGSFTALAAFISDVECDEAPAQAQEVLLRCGTCGACRAACPTGAIGEDRFLLHAERCITFWNEKDPGVPFPDWIEPNWHNALFGCLRCQGVCPENRPHLDRFFEGPTFDEATTQLLLSGPKREDLSPELVAMLEPWRLTDLLGYLPRNLGVLAKKEVLRREERGKRKGDGQ
jgi:epoxyqueuosine reductase